MTILIAEDSATSRKLLKSILLKKGFDVIETVDGEEAWEYLSSNSSPRIALIDWMMPKLNGIDLIKRIRENEKKRNKYTYLIMITSNSEENDIITGFEAGADDYITKPINPNTLEIRLKIAARIIRQQKELENQLNLQKLEIERAQEIQQALNTATIPQLSATNIRAVYNPSQEMGGDFFNVIKTPSCKIATIMVDCTGHGLEASMYATLLKSVCDRHLSLLDKPQYLGSFMQMVNIDVANYITSDQFPVMFVSIYDPESKKLYYSSANGEHPYLVRNGKTYKFEKAKGMHLGFNTESEYEVKSFVTKPDDLIITYSDAIIEIAGAHWDRHNDEPLKKELSTLGNSLGTDLMHFMRFIDKANGSLTLKDDLTIVFMQIKDLFRYETEITTKPELEPIKYNLINTLESYDYSQEDIDKIIIALIELVFNAIDHGNNGSPDKKVIINFEITCEKFIMTIEDQGNGFDETLIPDPTNIQRLADLMEHNEHEKYTHGRGVWMVKNIMDSVIFSRGGKMAVVTKKKPPSSTYYNYKITK